jgi:hypothetical protein
VSSIKHGKIFTLTLLFIALVFSSQNIFAEETVKDSKGNIIILHNDFTWEYSKGTTVSGDDIQLLKKTPNMTERVASKTGKFTIYYDPSLWTEAKVDNPSAEFAFKNIDNTGFCLTMFDGLSIPIEQMKDVLIINAQKIDQNAHIIDSQPCLVNGTKGEIVTYTAKQKSIEIIFYTLIVSKQNGTIQFSFYTLASAFNDLKPQFLKAMGGLVF